jgi:hypothetical protein
MTVRTVSWFSCGAASAVATKVALEEFPETEIFYCEVKEEHPSNSRFLRDCQDWFGKSIVVLGNDEFNRSAKEVFLKSRFLVGPNGARCTGELKRSLRWANSRADDINILGYTLGEENRLKRLQVSEPLTQFWPVLIERGISKLDCLGILQSVGIELPEMYKLGYKNNNCIGCVKGQAGYWNKIRLDFPEVFQEMARIERELDRKICKVEWREGGKRFLKRVFLDELPCGAGSYSKEPEIECGINCIDTLERLL